MKTLVCKIWFIVSLLGFFHPILKIVFPSIIRISTQHLLQFTSTRSTRFRVLFRFRVLSSRHCFNELSSGLYSTGFKRKPIIPERIHGHSSLVGRRHCIWGDLVGFWPRPDFPSNKHKALSSSMGSFCSLLSDPSTIAPMALYWSLACKRPPHIKSLESFKSIVLACMRAAARPKTWYWKRND